jgi:hypothetical protein
MLGVLREVVAQDRKGGAGQSSAASLLFEPPPAGDAQMTWEDLPRLRRDTADPQPAGSRRSTPFRRRPADAGPRPGPRLLARGGLAQALRGRGVRQSSPLPRPGRHADADRGPVGVAGCMDVRARRARPQQPPGRPELLQRRLRPGPRRARSQTRPRPRLRTVRHPRHRRADVCRVRAHRRGIRPAERVRVGPTPRGRQGSRRGPGGADPGPARLQRVPDRPPALG